ncbi:MAG: hypothetical protein BWZ10_01565 [candidate division BRC1 bacterium ADurb.BinA364]|nr:MAG: hypothetical protein BWZ10_01565 [candidate division BRC1 bacterium ADurb.BinA364]
MVISDSKQALRSASAFSCSWRRKADASIWPISLNSRRSSSVQRMERLEEVKPSLPQPRPSQFTGTLTMLLIWKPAYSRRSASASGGSWPMSAMQISPPWRNIAPIHGNSRASSSFKLPTIPGTPGARHSYAILRPEPWSANTCKHPRSMPPNSAVWRKAFKTRLPISSQDPEQSKSAEIAAASASILTRRTKAPSMRFFSAKLAAAALLFRSMACCTIRARAAAFRRLFARQSNAPRRMA